MLCQLIVLITAVLKTLIYKPYYSIDQAQVNMIIGVKLLLNKGIFSEKVCLIYPDKTTKRELAKYG